MSPRRIVPGGEIAIARLGRGGPPKLLRIQYLSSRMLRQVYARRGPRPTVGDDAKRHVLPVAFVHRSVSAWKIAQVVAVEPEPVLHDRAAREREDMDVEGPLSTRRAGPAPVVIDIESPKRRRGAFPASVPGGVIVRVDGRHVPVVEGPAEDVVSLDPRVLQHRRFDVAESLLDFERAMAMQHRGEAVCDLCFAGHEECLTEGSRSVLVVIILTVYYLELLLDLLYKSILEKVLRL